jgi:GNAT superfamily N-acetyltransferase
MNIRLAKRSDYEEIMDLYNIFVGNDRYSQHNNDSFQKVLDSKQNFIYVAEEDNKLIGFATFSIRDVVRYPKPIAELDELFVHEEYRKHGVGKQFMRVIEEKAKELNCHRMYIESHYDHKTAHAFYEKLGYTNYGYHFLKNL